jgi:hypothetical protein
MGILKNKAMWGGFLLGVTVIYIGTAYSIPLLTTVAKKASNQA